VDAQLRSLRTNFTRQSWDIVEPHYRQPLPVVAAMQYNRDLGASVPDGLIDPAVWVAALHALDL
jgi:hypothetical protein